MFNTITKVGLLSKADITRIYAQESNMQFIKATTTGGESDERIAQVAWLRQGPIWNWLYEIIWPWMMEAVPHIDFSPPHSAIQFTRYNEHGHYDWHIDAGDSDNRVLSTTVLLSSATQGGDFEIEEQTLPVIGIGDAVLFSSEKRHRVTIVTQGVRDSLVIWLRGSYTQFITYEYLQEAFSQLDIVFPHSVAPGSYPGGLHDLTVSLTYDQYEWNPPEYLKHIEEFSDIDTTASLKPTRENLLEVLLIIKMRELREKHIRILYEQCKSRIAKAYKVDSWEKEIEKRLGGRHTAIQDIERDRLREKHAIHKIWLADSSRTLTELEVFDLTKDFYWIS